MTYSKTNVNNRIKVKLKPKGIEILKAIHDDLYGHIGLLGKRPFVLRLDDDGYYSDQIWSFMRDFGEHMVLGMETPFETDVLVEVVA